MPWAIFLALMMRQAAARTAAPTHFPRFDTTDVVTFAFDDRRLLARRHHNAGAAWVSPNAHRGDSLPVLIYLHGLNRFRIHRRWMHGSQFDMRTIVGPMAMDGRTGPMIVAVPNTTSDMAQRDTTIYRGFDVAAFVDAIDRAVGARGFHVDRSRVIYSAHSASGCALRNGLFTGVGSPAVQTIFDIDCCMTPQIGRILAQAPPTQRVVVTYQTHMWHRDYDAFALAFRRNSTNVSQEMRVLQRLDVRGHDAHNAMVASSLHRWLPVFVPAATAPGRAAFVAGGGGGRATNPAAARQRSHH